MFTKLFWSQIILACVIGLVHITFLHYSIYWHYVWLDVPVHFLGGVWAGLFSWWFVRDVYNMNITGLKSLMLILIMVLAIGMAWEVFEMLIGSPQEANYVFDTKLDLIMDMFGGLTAWSILRLLNKI